LKDSNQEDRLYEDYEHLFGNIRKPFKKIFSE